TRIFNALGCPGFQAQEVALTLEDLVPRPEQCLIQHLYPGTLFLRDIAVPRTHGQAIAFPENLPTSDLHRDTQVFHHASDNRQLLKVLDAEDRLVRLHNVEQLAHHRGHTFEMARTARSAQYIRHRGHNHAGLDRKSVV